jgi:hypothetical protein
VRDVRSKIRAVTGLVAVDLDRVAVVIVTNATVAVDVLAKAAEIAALVLAEACPRGNRLHRLTIPSRR